MNELGHLALVLAFIASLAQWAMPLAGYPHGVRRAAEACFLLLAIAFFCLMAGFISSDFSLALVEAHSHAQKPLLYRVTGLWGNHEGSMLLWLLILSGYGAALSVSMGKSENNGLKRESLAWLGLIGSGFMAFALFASSPFQRLEDAPINGSGLNPLLQDIGLALHPPVLYIGYVGFAVSFAFAMAGMRRGEINADWARRLRPWALVAWSAQTAGLALGAWWAYYELGWGGWWFWDPVENAALLPWLAGTALIHCLRNAEKADGMRHWCVLLALSAFGFSLMGAFLVRSGLLTSVHAFALDPGRGMFLLILFAFYMGLGLCIYAIKGRSITAGRRFFPLSRETGLLMNAVLLSVLAASIGFGTLYPLFVDILGGRPVSVGPPFFNAVAVPLGMALMLLMGFGPMLAWHRSRLDGLMRRLWPALLILVIGLAFAALGDLPPIAALALAFAAWLIAASLLHLLLAAKDRRMDAGLYGMLLAHIGMAVAAIGMVGASALMEERALTMQKGDRIEFAGYDIHFQGERQAEGANYVAEQAYFHIRRNRAAIAELVPERRWYPVSDRITTEADYTTADIMGGDIYIALGRRIEDEQSLAAEDAPTGRWGVRLYHHPLVLWLWLGATLMTCGGLAALWHAMHRRRAR